MNYKAIWSSFSLFYELNRACNRWTVFKSARHAWRLARLTNG